MESRRSWSSADFDDGRRRRGHGQPELVILTAEDLDNLLGTQKLQWQGQDPIKGQFTILISFSSFSIVLTCFKGSQLPTADPAEIAER